MQEARCDRASDNAAQAEARPITLNKERDMKIELNTPVNPFDPSGKGDEWREYNHDDMAEIISKEHNSILESWLTILAARAMDVTTERKYNGEVWERVRALFSADAFPVLATASDHSVAAAIKDLMAAAYVAALDDIEAVFAAEMEVPNVVLTDDAQRELSISPEGIKAFAEALASALAKPGIVASDEYGEFAKAFIEQNPGGGPLQMDDEIHEVVRKSRPSLWDAIEDKNKQYERELLDAVEAVRRFYPEMSDRDVERNAVRISRQRVKLGMTDRPIQVDEI